MSADDYGAAVDIKTQNPSVTVNITQNLSCYSEAIQQVGRSSRVRDVQNGVIYLSEGDKDYDVLSEDATKDYIRQLKQADTAFNFELMHSIESKMVTILKAFN